jgi:hypothetical protein
MTTVVLDTRYQEAKKLIEKLRKARYAKVIDSNFEEKDEDKSILKACLESEKTENIPESDIMNALK